MHTLTGRSLLPVVLKVTCPASRVCGSSEHSLISTLEGQHYNYRMIIMSVNELICNFTIISVQTLHASYHLLWVKQAQLPENNITS